jgi:hypothetical protein
LNSTHASAGIRFHGTGLWALAAVALGFVVIM